LKRGARRSKVLNGSAGKNLGVFVRGLSEMRYHLDGYRLSKDVNLRDGGEKTFTQEKNSKKIQGS